VPNLIVLSFCNDENNFLVFELPVSHLLGNFNYTFKVAATRLKLYFPCFNKQTKVKLRKNNDKMSYFLKNYAYINDTLTLF